LGKEGYIGESSVECDESGTSARARARAIASAGAGAVRERRCQSPFVPPRFSTAVSISG
jgi:hypothetical protein